MVDKKLLLEHRLAEIPRRYRDITLEDLQPSPKSRMPEALQEKYIGMIQDDPYASYAFFGPVGWSKTTYSVALFRCMLERMLEWTQFAESEKTDKMLGYPCHVQRVHAKRLLEEHRAFACGELPPPPVCYDCRRLGKEEWSKAPDLGPAVCRDRIAALSKNGWTFHLFLEEIDKVQVEGNDFRLNTLFEEAFDPVYEWKGQVVINTNLTPREFEGRLGPQFARRIKEMCNVVNMFEEAQCPKEPSVTAGENQQK